MKIKSIITLCLLTFSTMVMAQSEAPENWFNLDMEKDNVPGVSTERTYEELLKGRKSETVVVAVIDSGVDYMHEDLKDIMWVNPGEIAGNGIDDDNNGYVDDIHGWNFIGGKDGKNINDDALEITRLYAHYMKKFKDVDPSKLKKKEKKQYKEYMEIKEAIAKKQSELAEQSATWFAMNESLEALRKAIGKDDFTKEELEALESDDDAVKEAKETFLNILSRNEGVTMAEIAEQVHGAYEYFNTQVNKWYNPEFDPRAEIVGDDYNNPHERYYGNNDVKGPDAGHGTHVSGIIAAVRDNNIGMKGVANNVRIMSVRAVPNGDERDKDVANAIRYAVDNGASIINMSFGKSYSWNKQIVDDAVRYAEKHDVLLIHAAGNDGANTDKAKNFPSDKYEKRRWFRPKKAKGWMEIGALTYKGGEDAVASFSNYGKENVDIFAPGYQIYSTIPDENQYASFSGTSMAAPTTAGVAAMLRAYFPKLSAKQIKNIIMATAVIQNQKVKRPGDKKLVSFSELCQTGGTVNLYKAVKLAEKTKGKRKMKRVIKKGSKNAARP